MNVNDASHRFELPHSMLYKCYRGETKAKAKENNGRRMVQTVYDKEMLPNYCIYMARNGDTNFLRTVFPAAFLNMTVAGIESQCKLKIVSQT